MKAWCALVAAWCAVCACAAYSRVGGGGGGGGRVFRAGASLRPGWAPPRRHAQLPSHRSPYLLYRNPVNRYVKPHFSNKFGGYAAGPWRASMRLPAAGASPHAAGQHGSPHASVAAYEYVRAPPSVAQPLRVDGDRGPIYTMPAPNLSLADRPIVVVDSQGVHASSNANHATNQTKAYEVTEKTVDPMNLADSSKFVASPSGPHGFTFSRAPSLASPEVLQLVRSSPQQFQLSDTYALPVLHQPQLLSHHALGPQLTLQGFNAIMQPSTGNDPNLLQQNILFQPDPNYMQKISHQLYQRFPGAEFIQYPVEPDSPAHIYVVEEDEKKDETEHINVVRTTDEGAVLTLVSEEKSPTANVSSGNVDGTSTLETTEAPTTNVANVSQLETTTAKLEVTTEVEKDHPIFYPQVRENVDGFIANGFYSALTDARAAEALASLEKSQQENTTSLEKAQQENTTQNKIDNFPVASNLTPYFVQDTANEKENKTGDALKPLHGSPFTKTEPPSNVAYSFLRREGDTKSEITDEGVRYAGQIVEATISDDDDFNQEKAAHRRRPPLRLYSQSSSETSEKPRKGEVKPKSKLNRGKLAYDDKTGEPIIRIYASSYESSKSSEEREPVTKKYSSNGVTRGTHKVKSSTPDSFDGWKSTSAKSLDRLPSGSDINQVTEFGLKLRPRMDDYISIFEDKKK